MGMWGPLSAGFVSTAAAVISLAAGGTPALAADEVMVAGVAPGHRPANAPVLTEFAKSPQWYAAATAGISRPIPPSLRFLDDQGAWFTPFTHPGMVGRYDLRGLHAQAAGTSTQSQK